MEGNVGDGKDEGLKGEQENLTRDKLYGLQYGG
jgi:hypothetical protein